jgi:hypothetical protein
MNSSATDFRTAYRAVPERAAPRIAGLCTVLPTPALSKIRHMRLGEAGMSTWVTPQMRERVDDRVDNGSRRTDRAEFAATFHPERIVGARRAQCLDMHRRDIASARQGRLYFRGRIKEMIKTGGINVADKPRQAPAGANGYCSNRKELNQSAFFSNALFWPMMPWTVQE